MLVPAYNEATRIESTLRDYLSNPSLNQLCELTLVPVLNGCRDATNEVVAKVVTDFPTRVQVIEETEAIGKGGALILGFSQLWNADLVGFTDADNSTKPEMFARLVRALIDEKKLDAAIASRYIKNAKVQGKSGR